MGNKKTKYTKNQQSWIKFIKDNPQLNRTKAYEEFKKQGGGIRKQTAFDIFRDLAEIKKGESKGKNFKEIRKEKRKTSSIFKTKATHYSKSNIAIKNLFDNIKKLYGKSATDKYIKVYFKIEGDEKTNIYKDFGILIPYEKNRIGVKTLYQEVIKQMQVYYDNLQKLYRNTINVRYNEIQNNLKLLKREYKNTKYPTDNETTSIFKKYGFSIEGIEFIDFVD